MKSLSFFRMHFFKALQYRAAAAAGILTQFFWGIMEILLFQAFFKADPMAFPMDQQALSSYIWLQQAFLSLFMVWFLEQDIFDSISSGNVAYEMCRPVSVYSMWYMRSIANRCAKSFLRAVPMLTFVSFLPRPFHFSLPASPMAAFWFILSAILGLCVVVSIGMLIYSLTFYMISPMGIRTLVGSVSELLSGAVIPLPFMPEKIRDIVELLPFASIQDLPLRVYSGSIYGMNLYIRIGVQIFWLIALTLSSKLIMEHALKKIIVQGG